LSQDASALEGQPQSPQPVAAAPLEEEDEDDSVAARTPPRDEVNKTDFAPKHVRDEINGDETVDEEIDPSVALGGPTGHLSQNVSLPSFGS